MAPLASSTSSSAATPDPYVDLFSSAPRVGPIAAAGALIPVLPLLRTSPFHDEPPLLCAAYKASCVGYSLPPRGTLSLASGAGGLGIGVPADASGRWKLRPKDFCKGPPQELGRLPGPKDRLPKDVPKPADCFCPTNSLEQRFNSDPRGFDRQLPAGAHPKVPKLKSATRCAPGRSFVTYQCSRTPLVPVTAATSPKPALLGRRLGRWTWSHRSRSSSSSGADGVHAFGVDVLLATSDHFGHGMFAMVQRVLNQIALATTLRLEPHVFLGEYTFMEPQACEFGLNPYYAAAVGDNVWEYWFEQPGGYSLGASRLADGRPVRSVQVTTVEWSAERPIRVYGTDEARMRGRRAAHVMLGTNGTRLVRQSVRNEARRVFAPWRARSRHIIGVHMRGTDKVVMPKVPPEAYFPLLDAYLAAHDDALIFLATDDRRYARRLGKRYPFGTRVVSAGQGYDDASWGTSADRTELLAAMRQRAKKTTSGGTSGASGASGGNAQRAARIAASAGYQKGSQVLLDALLLSMCDFILVTVSAVSEFALWIAPHLWTRHLQLQNKDRFKGQMMPEWTEHVPGAGSTVGLARQRAVAAAYCDALDVACAAEGNTPHRKHLYGGKYCNKCEPPHSATAEAAQRMLPELLRLNASHSRLASEG
jgi:hypothetical protein